MMGCLQLAAWSGAAGGSNVMTCSNEFFSALGQEQAILKDRFAARLDADGYQPIY